MWGAVPQTALLQQTGVQTHTITYGYDGLNRLTSAVESGATTNSSSYQYDKVGNRLDGGRTYDAANQVIGWSYDAAGNLLNDGTSTYGYDARNRMTQRGADGYVYNADGVLVRYIPKKLPDPTLLPQTDDFYTQDLAAPLPQILVRTAANGTYVARTDRYIYGTERLFAQQDSTRAWYAADALGSVRQTLNDSGAVLGNVAYDPWGLVQQGSMPTFGFTGELQQGANVYLRARWYNGRNGTFTSRDPFAGWPERPGTLQPYSYAGNDPVLLTDPSGRCYPPVESLRQIEPLNCSNLDAAFKIWNHPNASTWEKTQAGTYIVAFGGSHLALLAGAGILTWQAVAAGSGVVTALSQWGSAQVVAGTTAGQVLTTGATTLAAGGTAYTVYQAAQGDPHAQTALANPGVYGAATLWNDLAEAGVAAFCRPTLRSTRPFSARLSRDVLPDGGGTVDVQNAPYIVARLIRDQDWAVWGANAGAAQGGDFTDIVRSSTVQEALSRIPRSWMVERQAQGVGYRFINPDSTALVTEIRIKVPMAKFNRDWQSFAQLRLGKEVGKEYPGADRFGMIYYDRNLRLTDNLDAMHIRLAFDS